MMPIKYVIFSAVKKDEALLFVRRKDSAGNIPKKLMKPTFESRVIHGLSRRFTEMCRCVYDMK